MTKRNGYCNVGHGSLYYEAEGSGTPVIFIQGFGLNLRYWDTFVPALGHDHLTVRYDRRGFGHSSEPLQDAPYSDFDDLGTLLDMLDVSQAHIIAECIGGQVALEFALACPQRVKSLVLSNPDAVPGLAGANDAFFKLIEDTRPLYASGDLEGVLTRGFRNPILAPSLHSDEIRFRLTRALAGYHGWHFLHWYPRRSVDPPITKRLNEIAAPTLILAGANDYVHFRRVAKALQDAIPGARTEVIENAGHYSFVEFPEECARMVDGFLESVPGTPAGG